MSSRAHPLVIAWQVAGLSAAFAIGAISGLGPRVWLIALGLIVGAAAHAGWQRHRGPGPLDLPALRRTTLWAAGPIAVVCGALSVLTSSAPLYERSVVAVGTVLVAAFGTGILTLCGLSLGLGADQPVTMILPDATHPNRPRRPVRPRR